MNKAIALIVLITSAIVIYLYSDQQTNNVTEENKQQAKQNTNETPSPILQEKSSIKLQTTNKPSKKIKPPAAPTKKIIVKDNQKPSTQSTDSEQDSLKSYPIEDAEFYYVPPEERYPGNLGGPPPLELPDH